MCLFSFFLAAMLSVCSFFPSQVQAVECLGLPKNNFSVCSKILEKRLFENAISFTKKGIAYTYKKSPYTYVFKDERVDPEPTLPLITKFDQSINKGVLANAFPFISDDNPFSSDATACYYVDPKLFEYDGTLYAVFSKNRDMFLFKFDDEQFKGICHFQYVQTGTVLEYGEKNSLCQNILDKKYLKYAPEPLKNLIKEDDIQKIDFPESDLNGLYFAISHYNHQGVKADYNNDGKKDLLIKTSYDMECTNHSCGGYPFIDGGERRYAFRVYAPATHITKDIVSGAFPNEFPFNHDYGLAGKEYQEIINTDGKNYLLTSNEDAPVRLDEITTLPDGTNKTERLCSFKTQYEWR